jgi:hypothetical protein
MTGHVPETVGHALPKYAVLPGRLRGERIVDLALCCASRLRGFSNDHDPLPWPEPSGARYGERVDIEYRQREHGVTGIDLMVG